MMQCGRGTFGLPTMGSWLTYGLGNVSQNLPGYVVLSSGRGSSGGATLWQSGFLPSTYAGVLLRNQGEPVLNLSNPSGIPNELQRAGLNTLREVNGKRFEEVHDPEIAARIASYELAYRMQTRRRNWSIYRVNQHPRSMTMASTETSQRSSGGRG